MIVRADSDLLDLAESRGSPPKVVHLENCDYRTSQVERILRRHAILIAELEQSSRATLSIRNTTCAGILPSCADQESQIA